MMEKLPNEKTLLFLDSVPCRPYIGFFWLGGTGLYNQFIEITNKRIVAKTRFLPPANFFYSKNEYQKSKKIGKSYYIINHKLGRRQYRLGKEPLDYIDLKIKGKFVKINIMLFTKKNKEISSIIKKYS